MEKNDFIEKSPFFVGFVGEDLDDVIEVFKMASYKNGEVIFTEGDKYCAMYLVVSGGVTVTKKSKAGTMQFLSKLGPNAIFGEMAMIDNSPRSATAIADGACTLVMISKDDFIKLVQTKKRVALTLLLKIARLLSMKLRKTSAEYSDVLDELEKWRAYEA